MDISDKINKALKDREEVFKSKQANKSYTNIEDYLKDYFPNKLQEIYDQTIKFPSPPIFPTLSPYEYDFTWRPGLITYTTTDAAGAGLNPITPLDNSHTISSNTYYFGNYVSTLTNIKPYLSSSD